MSAVPAPRPSLRPAVTGMIKLALPAGKANPAPPVGPALGAKVRRPPVPPALRRPGRVCRARQACMRHACCSQGSETHVWLRPWWQPPAC